MPRNTDIQPDNDQPTMIEIEKTQWRSSMYGIDEEDLELVGNDTAPVIEEEEGLRDVSVSNPWVIAKMNVRSKLPFEYHQLLTPKKDRNAPKLPLNLSSPAASSHQQPLLTLPTPRTSSRSQKSIPLTSENMIASSSPISANTVGRGSPTRGHQMNISTDQRGQTAPAFAASQRTQQNSMSRKRTSERHETENPNDEWMRHTTHANVSNKRRHSQKYSNRQNAARDRGKKSRQNTQNGADIRDFFSRDTEQMGEGEDFELPSFTPIKGRPRASLSELQQSQSDRHEFVQNPTQEAANQLENPFSGPQRSIAQRAPPRPFSAGSFVANLQNQNFQNPSMMADRRSKDVQSSLRSSMTKTSSKNHDEISDQLHAYAERENRALALRSSLPQSYARIPILPGRPAVQNCQPYKPLGGLQRRRSSGKTSNNLPSEHCISHIELRIKRDINCVARSMQMLDMSVHGGNSLKRGHSATFNAEPRQSFSAPFHTVRLWSAKIYKLIDRCFEREDDRDTAYIKFHNNIYERLLEEYHYQQQDACTNTATGGTAIEQLVAAAAADESPRQDRIENENSSSVNFIGSTNSRIASLNVNTVSLIAKFVASDKTHNRGIPYDQNDSMTIIDEHGTLPAINQIETRAPTDAQLSMDEKAAQKGYESEYGDILAEDEMLFNI
ncbi:unnamed protein product [Periconia digitata]|uniref:Uncharacterized protein n=1 Tax=Periconia digitata TaxID=1303443 RepID=A0A9W4XL16_9PLEO|nr:unnamed protein product [Periconia digitata]